MIKKTITYTDYNGVSRTEDFWFNLTTAELMKMELGTRGGFSEMITRIVQANDVPTMMKVFDDFIRKSYGQKSPDGKRFIKSEAITEEFCQTEAYSNLFIEFITDTDKAIEFMNGIVPAEISKKSNLVNQKSLMDGTNINNNCGSTHIESLQELVLREHLDAGFAFDGDADRCLCVDEKGNVITGDHILYIYGCYMKERGKLVDNKVVTTVMSNFGLYKAFDAVGIDYEKTKVGDKYVYECMSKNGYRLGGEQSGHIIFSKYATTGDGIITALKMMEVMLAKKKPLSQLAEPLAIYPQVLKNVRVTDKTQAQNDADVRAMVERAAKELGTDGRILVRESGTEPLVRVMVEAGNVETCEKYVDAVIDVIRSKGYVIE